MSNVPAKSDRRQFLGAAAAAAASAGAAKTAAPYSADPDDFPNPVHAEHPLAVRAMVALEIAGEMLGKMNRSPECRPCGCDVCLDTPWMEQVAGWLHGILESNSTADRRSIGEGRRQVEALLARRKAARAKVDATDDAFQAAAVEAVVKLYDFMDAADAAICIHEAAGDGLPDWTYDCASDLQGVFFAVKGYADLLSGNCPSQAIRDRVHVYEAAVKERQRV